MISSEFTDIFFIIKFISISSIQGVHVHVVPLDEQLKSKSTWDFANEMWLATGSVALKFRLSITFYYFTRSAKIKFY